VNKFFSIIISLYGISLIAFKSSGQRMMRTIDIGIDPVGFGAFFLLLGIWLFINDKGGKSK